MKTCYYKRHGAKIAVVDLSKVEPRVYEVNRINVPEAWRGAGVARELMAEVLRDADSEGVTLRLLVNPYGDMDQDALIAWYERLGFSHHASGYMVRTPL